MIMNDWSRQTISSSPISVSKIVVAPTTSAPALVLWTFMHVWTFRILMEQRTIIFFLTFKDLLASTIAGERNSVYETGALALSAVKEWSKRFAEGRISLSGDPRCGRPLTNNFTGAISLMLKERSYLPCKILCRHICIAKETCLRSIHDTLGMKSFIFVGFPMLWTRIRRPKAPTSRI
jgi:hypothetical protein